MFALTVRFGLKVATLRPRTQIDWWQLTFVANSNHEHHSGFHVEFNVTMHAPHSWSVCVKSENRIATGWNGHCVFERRVIEVTLEFAHLVHFLNVGHEGCGSELFSNLVNLEKLE